MKRHIMGPAILKHLTLSELCFVETVFRENKFTSAEVHFWPKTSKQPRNVAVTHPNCKAVRWLIR
jgi:hypothetical protein